VSVLARWNDLNANDAAEAILPCCGSKTWADGLAQRRPIQNKDALFAACDEVWSSLAESDWLEAFRSHPRIGESAGETEAPRSSEWSREEQRNVGSEGKEIKVALAAANQEYERRFQRIFIVCATNKSAAEILGILQRRLRNDEAAELKEAAEQQRQIAHIRLKKWLAS
jgi:2-oxo-4-hydroxy-4-carboxy-5-ureidoimidazoline decarboxylase